MNKKDKETLKNMMAYIRHGEVADFKEFAEHCFSEFAPEDWCEMLTERYTLFLKEYIDSCAKRRQ